MVPHVKFLLCPWPKYEKNYKRGLGKECQWFDERVNTGENISYPHVSVVL
jgi:hypothetical protein